MLPPARIAVIALAAISLAGAVSLLPGLLDDDPAAPTRLDCGQTERLLLKPEQAFAGFPSISGKWVAWAEALVPVENRLGLEADIWAHNIETGESFEVASGPALQTVPRVHDGTVVWTEDPLDGTPRRLEAMELETRESWTLDLPGPVRKAWGLSGTSVLYTGGGNLTVFDMQTGAHEVLVNHTVGVADIWRDRVVWTDYEDRNGSRYYSIELHNLTTGETRHVLDTRDPTSDPAIYGDRIVYMRVPPGQNSTFDLYLHDLKRNESSPIATDEEEPTIQQEPRVRGEWTIYAEDPRAFDPGIYAQHLPTGTIVRLTESPGDEHDIWRNIAAFIEVNHEAKTRNLVLQCLELPDPSENAAFLSRRWA